MNKYTAEKHIQIIISLLKQYGIKKIVISPGNTNVTFVVSVQNDPFFELYSCVDERSAAYMACGLASKSDEAVVLSCTGATASRNYFPGLTEAYYRKLPILALTSTQYEYRAGNNIAQVIDRSSIPKDAIKYSVSVGVIHNQEEEELTIKNINYAIQELFRSGGGPVHINLTTTYNRDFSVSVLPNVKKINRYNINSDLPSIPNGQVVIWCGEHKHFTKTLTDAIDSFCKKYNSAVFCDMTSDYQGKYRFDASLLCSQDNLKTDLLRPNLVIHIGNIAGHEIRLDMDKVWRVNQDGEFTDTFLKLDAVFQMNEEDFFEAYSKKETSENKDEAGTESYYNELESLDQKIRNMMPEVPFSNIWIAQNSIRHVPDKCNIYFSILNTLRSWNYCKLPVGVSGFSNTGGFGIDGGISTALGISLADPEHITWAIAGDLQFFYDMNALGNRHVPANFRVMVINNGVGTEFKNYNHFAASTGEDTDKYIAARGHFGCQSTELIKHYAEDLGFIYLCADNKKDFLNKVDNFFNNNLQNGPILFEIFTDSVDESNALMEMRNIVKSYKSEGKKMIKSIIGEKNLNNMKKILKK